MDKISTLIYTGISVDNGSTVYMVFQYCKESKTGIGLMFDYNMNIKSKAIFNDMNDEKEFEDFIKSHMLTLRDSKQVSFNDFVLTIRASLMKVEPVKC